MPVPYRTSGISSTPPPATVLSQQKFPRGVMSIVDPSNLPKTALQTGDNITLVEDGAPSPRPGMDWYGTDLAEVIDGGTMHVQADKSTHLLSVSDGVIKRSTNDGATWDTCTGATLTAGKKVATEQANDDTYIVNGWDFPVRYNGTTTLETYTSLPTPTGGSAVKTGLAGTTYTLRYRVSAVNDVGYTIASTAATVQVDRQRLDFSDSNFVTFTWAAVTGAVRYDIYVGQIADQEVYIDSLESGTTYLDKGQALEQVQLTAPDSNTTTGPRVGDVAMVGTRLYATADRDNPYRIWISGAGRFVGQFSGAYDATYIDWQKGGQYRPVKVEDYRDGKGMPLATVWCESKDGLGCILQGTLESFTVGDVTFPVPNFFKVPGSRGTDAPFSVVNVLNDYMYYNSQAFYNLGSRAQFLNLLSTDESSANIRPDVKSIRQNQSMKIAGHFQDAKVYFSVPVASDDNDTTMIYDTERKAWMPRGFTVGFERLFTYTDTNNNRKLLAWKSGDTRFTEISESYRGDYGVPFDTTLRTGLIHVDKDRMAWMEAENAEFEFAQVRGNVTVELAATLRDDGFQAPEEFTKTLTPDSVLQGYGLAWTTYPWTYAGTEAVVAYSEPTTKRFFEIEEDINNYQYTITTTGLEDDYILRLLQVAGTPSQGGKEAAWELTDS